MAVIHTYGIERCPYLGRYILMHWVLTGISKINYNVSYIYISIRGGLEDSTVCMYIDSVHLYTFVGIRI